MGVLRTDTPKDLLNYVFFLQRTGHRSLDALRKYEKASDKQVAAVSSTLAPVAPEKSISSKEISLSTPVPLQPVALAKPGVSQSASSLSAFSLGGCNFQNCTVNFIANLMHDLIAYCSVFLSA